MKPRCRIAFFLVILLFALPVKAETLPLATGEWEPYTGSQLTEGGPVTQLIRAVVQEMGMEAEISYYPWPRAELVVKTGKAFGTFPYGWTEERAQDFDFSDPYLHTRTVLFYLKGHLPITDYTALRDLRAFRVGGNRGYSYLPLFAEAGLHYDIVTYQEQLIRMLNARRFDLVAVDRAAGWMHIRRLFPGRVDEFTHMPTPIETVPRDTANLLMISRSYPDYRDLTRRFNDALQRLRANGRHGEIIGQLYEGS